MKTCSNIEPLESRIAPANIVVEVIENLLNIVGDRDANVLLINGDVGDATKFVVTSTSDTINGGDGLTGFTTPSGITGISIKMLKGDDTVSLDNTVVAIHLHGGLKIHGGDGANKVTATDLTVDNKIKIINGDAGMGIHVTTFTNLNVGGSVSITNKAGNTQTLITRVGAGFSMIGGDVSITNGAGIDTNIINDTNIGHNVTINNGHGNTGSVGGSSRIYNNYNTAFNTVIGGNVSVSYLDGDRTMWDGIWDTHVLGNVTFDHGKGEFTTYLDGYVTGKAVVIDGNLTIKGTGPNIVYLGTGWARAGLDVGKKLSISSGNAADTVEISKLRVFGNSTLTLGNGVSDVRINDSRFAGTFGLTTGRDTDTINIETAIGTSASTIFAKPVLIKQGEGNNTIILAGGADTGQRLGIYSSFVVHRGSGPAIKTEIPGSEFFPFGNSVVWVA